MINLLLLTLVFAIQESRICDLKEDLRKEKIMRKHDNEFSELSRKLSVDMAIVDERMNVVDKDFRKICEDFQETCRDFSESVKVK